MEDGPWWEVDSSEQGEHIVRGVEVNHLRAEPVNAVYNGYATLSTRIQGF